MESTIPNQIQIELYDEGDPVADDVVEIPLFDTHEEFLKWQESKNKV